MSCISNIIQVTTSPVKECATTLQCPPMVGPCPGRTGEHLVMIPMAKLKQLRPENNHHLTI